MKNEIEFLNEKEIDEVFSRFQKINPTPISELVAPNDFTFLISVVLSAQATDKSVNAATKELYKIADTPEKMLALGEKKIIEHICTIGLYRNKTKFIIGICERLIKDFNSKIPQTEKELLSLPGVVPSERPILGLMRKICVSTGIVGLLKTALRITFVVFRPTPGKLSNSFSVCGILLLKSFIKRSQIPIMNFVLFL